MRAGGQRKPLAEAHARSAGRCATPWVDADAREAAVGTAAAELLLRRLGAPPQAEAERILLTTQLVLRESCGPLPKVAARKTRVAP